MIFHYDDPDRVSKMKAFIVLGDATCLKILYVLDRQGEKNFSELKEIIEVNPASLSKKLRVLAEAGILNSDRTHDNLRVYYSIAQHKRQIRKFLESFERLAQEL
ncbi:MAG TPA: ArsR family transcriptional regulator [Candidatus Saccharibacteria bacterium]|jgi:DNA-binding HxlR family transcriptional regulator|nr:ArsR family transcriptional regulator [Candidatus Saccharibacteria bacterium]HMT56022.1 ArsR family transcriptional regulator [Candidatus Saccharibacteria bacterium]